jgi:hypothetical protein
MVSVCASVRPNTSHEMIQNRAAEANFYVFRYNYACRPQKGCESKGKRYGFFVASNFCHEFSMIAKTFFVAHLVHFSYIHYWDRKTIDYTFKSLYCNRP